MKKIENIFAVTKFSFEEDALAKVVVEFEDGTKQEFKWFPNITEAVSFMSEYSDKYK